MAEFCLRCLNGISGTDFTEADFILSKERELCENCGKMVRVVVRRRHRFPVTFLKSKGKIKQAAYTAYCIHSVQSSRPCKNRMAGCFVQSAPLRDACRNWIFQSLREK